MNEFWRPMWPMWLLWLIGLVLTGGISWFFREPEPVLGSLVLAPVVGLVHLFTWWVERPLKR